MKKFLSALIIFMIFTASAYAAGNPVRIARLPIIFKSTMPDYETRTELEMKIARATHIPMNKTLQVAEYLPTENSTQALNDIWQKMRSENKKARLQDAMKPLAQKLDADIVICPILLRYSQYTGNLSGFDDVYIQSYARAEMIIYDRRADNLIDKKNSQMYNDVFSPYGTVAYLAKVCFDNVIDDSKLHSLITAIGK